MGTPTTIYVTKEFEDSTGVIQLQNISAQPVVNTTTIFIGSVPGKRIRIVSFIGAAITETCYCSLTSVAGSIDRNVYFNVVKDTTETFPFQSVGWFETDTGKDAAIKFVSATNTGSLNFSARYLVITP